MRKLLQKPDIESSEISMSDYNEDICSFSRLNGNIDLT